MKYTILLLLVLATYPLVSQNYIGLRNDELFDGNRMKVVDDNLYVVSEQSGISRIDLKSSYLISVMEDTDTSSYRNWDFMYSDGDIYTEDMNVFDRNTLELTNKLPFEGRLFGVSDKNYFVHFSDFAVHIIDKQDYDSIKVLKFNENLSKPKVAYNNGYILAQHGSEDITIYNELEKVGFIQNASPIFITRIIGSYVVADMFHKKIVYDFEGNIVYESNFNVKSSIYINDDLDYIYIDKVSDEENEIVTGNLLSEEEQRVAYVNPIWNNFYYYILGFYDGNYIVYDRVESYFYKFSPDLQRKEHITKFNTLSTNLQLLDLEKYNYAVVGSYGYLELTLFNSDNSDLKRIGYSHQNGVSNNIIFPYFIANDYVYAPTKNENKNRILKYNIETDEREYIGEFDSLITCIYIDEIDNLLYVGDKESNRFIYNLSDYALVDEFSLDENSCLDIINLNNNILAVTQNIAGISVIDFKTNEVYAEIDGVNSNEDGTQFNYSENGEIFICPDGNGGITVYDLTEKKEIANYSLEINDKITSLAITNSADFIVIGTENDGVYEYTPGIDILQKSEQNRLIPTSNISGELSYSKVHDIKIDEKKSKYHFIVVDMVFATSDYEIFTTNVEGNKELKTISLENGILNLENYSDAKIISISNISGQKISYSQVEQHKYKINNTDKLLFLKLRNGTEVVTFKIISD